MERLKCHSLMLAFVTVISVVLAKFYYARYRNAVSNVQLPGTTRGENHELIRKPLAARLYSNQLDLELCLACIGNGSCERKPGVSLRLNQIIID